MNTYKKLFIAFFATIFLLYSCSDEKKVDEKSKPTIIKGLYSFGPEIKSFTDCIENKEYWVADSAKTLELAYNNLGFEKPYTPVYIEAECHFVKSDTSINADYDSTMVVTKLIKISKEIPEGPCSQ
ncbi:MAG: hypothetical protein V4546_12775 [Bacteroidota bacterium]|uniref:NlpE C-terminal OB domain-containing protein n=1 Tax=Pedobacter cryotolerans TaxID=2571270 RepID=A0A4U1CDG6_9SPHI|nr:hypothetical protein [Pedobacter cryotolerans]TKC02034.1 hypothetical protein FA045_07260 [Pedobacter cryotolerans]